MALGLNPRFAFVSVTAIGFAIAYFYQRGQIDSYYRQDRWMVVHEHAEQAEPDVTLILGDSLVERQRIVDMCGPALNAGVIGSTTLDLLPHVAPLIALSKPKQIVINLGVNDKRTAVPLLEFVARFGGILDQTKAIPTLVVGIFSGGPYDDALRGLVEKRQGRYTPYPVDARYTIDGLHLSADGAGVWRTAVRKALCGA